MAAAGIKMLIPAASISTGSWLLLLFGFLSLGFLARGIWETGALQVTRVKIGSETENLSLRLVFFSDLHAEHLRLKAERLIAEIRTASPDIVVFGGDMAARESSVPKAIEVMRRIKETDYGKDILFLAVPGNHDTAESMNLLSEAGYIVLDNDNFIFRHETGCWQFIGLPDLEKGGQHLESAFQIDPDLIIPASRRIVIAHNPDSLLYLQDASVLLFLAGHFHGGQIWAPFRLEYKLLRNEKLASMGYTRGLFNWKDIHAYISRGIGCVLIPLRLFSRPELTVIDISGTGFMENEI